MGTVLTDSLSLNAVEKKKQRPRRTARPCAIFKRLYLSCKCCVILGQQVNTVLVQAGSFLPGMFGERTMQAFGNAQFELAGIALKILRFADGNAFFQGCFQPGFFGIQCIGNCQFNGISNGDAAGQIRIRNNKSALFLIGWFLNAINETGGEVGMYEGSKKENIEWAKSLGWSTRNIMLKNRL